MMKEGTTREKHREALKLIWDGSSAEALYILLKLDETPEVLNDRAVALHQMGRTDEAIPVLKKALERLPNYMPAVLNHLYMNLVLEAKKEPLEHKVHSHWCLVRRYRRGHIL